MVILKTGAVFFTEFHHLDLLLGFNVVDCLNMYIFGFFGGLKYPKHCLIWHY